MQELVEFIAKSLVEHPDKVKVEPIVKPHETVYRLQVDPEDMGRVIGKQGRIAQALRTVVKAAAIKSGERVYVDISDTAVDGTSDDEY
ncbi:MAG: KH domain-containing protein [Firmicutes bacterium]|nr:KH domain-containing protein [Bacillota bacterium]